MRTGRESIGCLVREFLDVTGKALLLKMPSLSKVCCGFCRLRDIQNFFTLSTWQETSTEKCNQALNPFKPVLEFCIVPEQRGECNYSASDYPALCCLLIHLAVVSLHFCLSHITCLLIMLLLFFLLQSVNKDFFSVYNPSPQAMHFQLYSDSFLEWKHKVCESVRLKEWLVLVLFLCRIRFGLLLF